MTEPCVVLYKGHPYDVGAFVDAHPGGRDLIVQLRNQDMTDAYDDIGHSKSADRILAKYRVRGDATSDESREDVQPRPSTPPATLPPRSGNHLGVSTRVLCAIVGFAGVCPFLYHSAWQRMWSG